MNFPIRFTLSVLLLLFGICAAESQPDPRTLVTPQLIADTTAVAPGKPFTVGVVLKLAKGWHTYWQFPGDSGGAPKVEWTLPDGFQAGDIQWPLPHERMEEGDLLTYVYEDEVLFPVQITPPAQISGSSVTLKAAIRWLVCEKTCIPGRGTVELTLPVSDKPEPANADTFAKWRAQLPKENPPFGVAWDRSKADQFTVKLDGIPAGARVEFYPLPPDDAKPDHPKVGEPATDGSRIVTVPISEGAAPNLPWKGLVVLAKEGAPREGWLVTPETAKRAPAPQAASVAPPPPADTALKSTPPAPAQDSRSLPGLLFLAFCGGLILNVMPCVLPVIALKIFGFVKQAGEDPKRIFRLGLAFVAGVFAFFLTIAVVIIALHKAGREFNWAFQFTNPYAFAGLIAIVFLFGLNLLGVFEITLSGGATSTMSALSSREGYVGAFLHGLFTTLLGTSCTAPMLGPALGYAVLQPPPIILLSFLTIAAGMSLPYLLLTARPAWLRFVPKPGAWMERVKQAMGFIMLAVAAWLLTILTLNRPAAAAGLIPFLLALAVGAWVYGAFNSKAFAWVLSLAIPIAAYFLFLKAPLSASPKPAAAGGASQSADSDGWQPYSDERLASAVQRGQAVFVDFTADWCINCKVFERTVLETDAVRKAFREKGVALLRADWTDADPKITQALKRFSRVGVPLYVLYRPGEEHPVVLDALTQQILLHHLAQIKGGQS